MSVNVQKRKCYILTERPHGLWKILVSGVFGESVSVTEGDLVTLHTDVFVKDDQIVWTFGAEKAEIANIKIMRQIFSMFDGPDGRFRDRLKVDNQTGSLIIPNIRSEHAGDYEVTISGSKFTAKTFRVSVNARLPVPVIFNSPQCSSSSSVQYCSVLCSVVNVSAVSLSWYKGNSLLSSISVSDLSISLSLPLEVEYQDKNTYSCVINNTISNQTTQLDTNTLWQHYEGPPGSGSLLMLISAATAGSLLIISAVWIFCICRKHRETISEAEILTEVIYTLSEFNKSRVHESSSRKQEQVLYAPVTS
ncbi:T-cell surface antigen CD2-like [Danio aesculapii]|uniref:T-cell surface antigen CD2-like n=1 Tax=Danio aesculapii TaxID=1142201 RepID=UPI0024BFAEC8|nr:T-cell surface antigen CD2-like [Danio aesculapii]